MLLQHLFSEFLFAAYNLYLPEYFTSTMIIRSKSISYLKAGYLLHLMTLLEITLYVFAFQYLKIGEWLNAGNLFWKILLLLPFMVAPFFPQLDAYSRFQNYKQIKDHLYLRGFKIRILKPFIQSRCQRDAAMLAAEELGMKAECKQHFYEQGYRWYHLLPDFLFTHPQTLFCKAFWLNTFFAKKYQAKYDFRKISVEINKETIVNVLQELAV